MKIKSSIFAVSMLAALSGSAANFVFHGNVSGDMLDVKNWYEVSGTLDKWSIPINNGSDWEFSAAKSLPTDGDTVGIARYKYGTESQILLPKPDKYIGVSASIGNVIIGEGSGRNNTIWIGSDGHVGEDFTLTMDSYSGGSYQNATNNFYVNPDASQNSYSIKVLVETYLTNDTHNWGSLIDDKALDRIEITDLKLTFQKVFFNTYAKSYYISGSVNMNFETNTYNNDNTLPANKWTVYVPQNALTLDEPLIRIDGDLKREDQFDMLSEIVFDFNWDYDDYAPGEYTLLSVGGDIIGFDDGDGISIASIDETKWTLKWKGNDLFLVPVPEPANVAAVLGALALAAVAYARRRK